MILKGISVNQDPPTKDYLWITPKGNTRFWNQSTWMLIGGSGDTGGSGFLSTTLFNTYINGNTDYLAKFTGPHTLSHSFLKIGYNSGSDENYLEFGTTDNVSSRIYYDATHKALRVTGGIYADWVSALGPNGEIGSGGSSNAVDWTALGTEGNEKIHISHIPDLTSVLNNIYQLKLPTTGNASATYVINISGNASTATSATSAISAGKWTTARTFKIKDIASNYGSNVSIDGSSNTYELPMPANIKVTSLTIGNAKLTFDDSSGVNMLKVDGVSGQTFNGIYSTKAVSALGGNPLNGAGGSSGVDWGALGTYDNNSDHKINVGYLDGVINTNNIPDIYQTKLTYSNGLYAISISGNASTATYATSAGSATTATTATKLGSSTVGSSTKGIYLSSGIPTACSYNLQANVSAGTNDSIAYYSVSNSIPTLNYSNVIKYLNDNNSLSKQRRGFQIAATCVGNTQTDLISNTAGKLSYGDGGPQIVFDESNTFSGQPGALIYTTHDYAGFGSTWHFVSSQNDWNVISKRFHARTGLSVGDDLPPGRSGNSSLWSTLQNYNLYVNGKTYLTNELRIGDAIVKWENGGLHIYNSTSGNTAGLYADWISALGVNSSGGSGVSGGLDIPTLWSDVLTQSDGGLSNYQGEKINSTLLPISAWALASNKPSYSFNEITGIIAVSQIPTLSITDKTSGTLPITRGGTGRTTSPTITVNLSSTSTGTSLLPSSGNVSTGISGTLAIANGGTGATTAKGAEYNILSEASTALETDFNNTTRFAIEHINPSATNGVLVGYRTASQLWSYIKGKMSSDSAVNISGNAATATIFQNTRTINGTNFNGSANITTNKWGTARNISISDADGTNTGDAVSVNGSENKTLKLPSTIKASLNGTVNGYSIASTINDGTTNRLAYYSDANVIDDATYIGCDGTRLCVGGNVDTNYAFKVTNGRSYTDFYPAADFGSNAIGFNARCRYNPSGLNGSNNFEAVGLLGQYIGSANNTNIDCYGIKGFANNDGTYHINGKCIGIQGYALKGNTNYGVQASLFVDTSSTTNRGFTTYLSGTPASNSTNMGINVENLFSAGTNYGIRALVSGATSNTNYAVYASATNGTNNWGIYSYRGKNYFYDSVGIGTISPAYKLDINGNVHTNSDFYLDNTKKIYLGNNASTTVYQDVMRLDSSNNFIIGNGTSASNYNTYLDGFKIYLRTNTGHSTRLYINEDGNVGIGNTSPNTKLHVSGNIYATGGVTALQAVSSDKRLKKNIKKFNAKDIVDKLNPVSFEWNSKAKKLSDFKDGTNYGLIAQDSDGIIDNLVFDLPNGKGYKGVRYEKLIPILLQAVKEQQKEIDELKQIIKKLKV